MSNPQLTRQRSELFLGAGLAKGVPVKLSSASTIPSTVALATSDNDSVIGITQAASYNGVVPVGLNGSQGEILLAGSVNLGDPIGIDGTAASSGELVVATALESGSSGEFIAVEIQIIPPAAQALVTKMATCVVLGDSNTVLDSPNATQVTLPENTVLKGITIWMSGEGYDNSSGTPGVQVKVGSTQVANPDAATSQGYTNTNLQWLPDGGAVTVTLNTNVFDGAGETTVQVLLEYFVVA